MINSYDSFGRRLNSVDYRSYPEPSPYLVDEPTPEVTYICYNADALTVVRRIQTVGGVTTIEIGYGKWENRARLNYQPVNNPIVVGDNEN